jgi:hypothetical protein
LLLDNVTDAEALTGALPPAGAGHVLITTRSAYWPPGIGLEVPVLDQPAAVGYLLARAAPDPPGEADAAAAAEVATELGGLPLALEQAAAYLQETSRTLPQYRVLLGQRRAELLARGQPWGYAFRVASTWDLSFDALRASAPDAVSLLRLASCLAPEAIPLGLLLGTGQPLHAELDDTGVAAALAPLLRDGFAVDDARRALGDYSLARGAPGDMLSCTGLSRRSPWTSWTTAPGTAGERPPLPLSRPRCRWTRRSRIPGNRSRLLLPHALATFDPGRPGPGPLLSYLDVSGDYRRRATCKRRSSRTSSPGTANATRKPWKRARSSPPGPV